MRTRALADQFVRLLFNNSEEVKRIRFISDRVRLGMRLHWKFELWDLVRLSAHQALL
jgi:hypothetical protein